MHSRVTRVPFITLAIGATILAAGCASTGSPASSSAKKPATTAPASPQQVLALVGKRSQTVTSIAATLSVQSSSSSTGAVSLAGTFKEQLRPSLVVEADLPTLSYGGQSLPGGLSEIVTTKALYLRSPELMQALHISKTWAEIQLTSLGGAGSTISSLFSEVQSNNPISQMQLLATSPDVRKVGTSVIGGVPVTEYAGSYSMTAALAQLPASLASQLQSAAAKSGISAVQFKIWVDGQNEPRKIVVTEGGTTGTVTITEVITSINQPVNIQLPTAGETYVVPASQLGS